MIVEHRDFFDEQFVKAFLDTFEGSLDSVVITTHSEQEHFLYVNEAFKKKTGYSESDLLGKSPRILQGPKTNPFVIQERLFKHVDSALYESKHSGKNKVTAL